MSHSFGSYQLLHRIATGGMAETFVAIRRGPEGFKQRVCIKRVLPALRHDALFVQEFISEARLAAQLNHANIVQVIDFGESEGIGPYLALNRSEEHTADWGSAVCSSALWRAG